MASSTFCWLFTAALYCLIISASWIFPMMSCSHLIRLPKKSLNLQSQLQRYYAPFSHHFNFYPAAFQNAYQYWLQWPMHEMRCVDILMMPLVPESAIVPGQKTVLTVPLEDRPRISKTFQDQEASILFLGWVETLFNGTSTNALTLKGSANAKSVVRVVGYAALAEVLDQRLLEASGEITLQIFGRCQIKKLLNLTNLPHNQSFQVQVIPYWDQINATCTLKNEWASKNNLNALHELYTRCNQYESHYRHKQRQHDLADQARLRAPLHEKVSELIEKKSNVYSPCNHPPQFHPELEEMSWTSFCAMDNHMDPSSRCWALELQDPELRMEWVRHALEMKLKKLQAYIRQ